MTFCFSFDSEKLSLLMNRQARTVATYLLGAVLLCTPFCGRAAAVQRAGALARLFAHVGDYPLGNTVNRMDYESVDPVGRRLYIAKWAVDSFWSSTSIATALWPNWMDFRK